MRMDPRWILGAALALGCRTAPPPQPPAMPASTPAPTPDAGPDRSSPQAITRAWIAAVTADNWAAIVPLVPPAKQARARRDLEELTAEQKAKLRGTARTLATAIAAKPPEFVRVEAVLAEPTHHEWYFCGRKPQGQFWAPPCAVSVIELDGRWYLLDVIDNPDAD